MSSLPAEVGRQSWFGVTIAPGTVLKGHIVRKFEVHWASETKGETDGNIASSESGLLEGDLSLQFCIVEFQ